ncbi:MAG: FIVAR domain-containing protein [Tenericutes bacterium]|nr:FIVAR domain-containing protein [Mycoplasmatota bacterium]
MKKLKKLMILITLIFALSSSVFCYSVFAADDVTQLQDAYDNAENAMNTQTSTVALGDPFYQVDSYQAFSDTITTLGGLAGIQAVIDEPTSLQVDVDALTSDINDALAALITDATHSSTLGNYFTANSILLTPYTSDSQALYNAELDRIELILNNPTAGELVIQGLNVDIDNAENLLVLRGDKTNLNTLIIQVETIYASVGVEYIPSTFTNFKTSYDNVDISLVADTGKTLQEIVDDINSTVSEVQAAELSLNNSLLILVLRPDKTQLQSDYDTALTVDSTVYTSSSFSLFTSGLVITKAVLDNVEATTSDVTQAITDLGNLYSVLVLKGDVTAAQTLYNDALSQDLSIYTPNSQTLYQNELDRINTILLSDDTDQLLADQAVIDIQAVSDLLVLQSNRTNLEILNQLLIKVYYEERQLYTASTHTAFQTACNDFGSYLYINTVINDDNSTQAVVDSLEASIQSALDLLVPLVDNSSILLVYYELRDADLSIYTTNSQNDYIDELNRLYQITIGNELDSDTFEEVLLSLSELDGLLVELPDYTQLQFEYDSMSVYREEDYSVSSYSIFSSALIYAENMLANLNASQEEIDATIVLLNNSVNSLKQTIEPIFIRENATLDITQYLTLGTSTIVSYDIEDSNVLSVNYTGVIKGLSYGKTNISIILSNGAIEIIEVNVIARVKLPVYIMTFSIPVVAVGLGSVILFGKKEVWIKLLTNIKSIFKKKK